MTTYDELTAHANEQAIARRVAELRTEHEAESPADQVDALLLYAVRLEVDLKRARIALVDERGE